MISTIETKLNNLNAEALTLTTMALPANATSEQTAAHFIAGDRLMEIGNEMLELNIVNLYLEGMNAEQITDLVRPVMKAINGTSKGLTKFVWDTTNNASQIALG